MEEFNGEFCNYVPFYNLILTCSYREYKLLTISKHIQFFCIRNKIKNITSSSIFINKVSLY